MRAKESICAVVVTFNRKELLNDCLKGLLAQTRKVDAIIIVDNASSDNTAEFLMSEGYIQQLPPDNISEPVIVRNRMCIDKFEMTQSSDFDFKTTYENNKLDIIYVRMNRNTGGAGGFHEGIKLAYELGYEWFWVMDDDGFPDANCLYTLEQSAYRNKLKVLNALVIDKDNKNLLSFALSRSIQTVNEAVLNGNDNGLVLGFINPFNGTFINKEVVTVVGNIKKEMFIWGDETEYTKRIIFNGFECATVVDACFYHPTSKKTYKRMFWGLFHLVIYPDALGMNFYRNEAYINRVYGRFYDNKILLRHIVSAILEGEVIKSIWIFRYYIDGFFDLYKLPSIRYKEK